MPEESAKPEGANVSPPPAAQPKNRGEKPEATKLGSPHDHAKAVGSFRSRKARGGDVIVSSVNGQSVSADEYSWQHNSAAALHGWAEHEHHEAKPIELSVEAYRAALLAASEPVTRVIDKDGKPGATIDSHEAAKSGIPTLTDYEPHAPALSKHAAHAKKTEAAKTAEAARG